LPIWVDFMKEALNGRAAEDFAYSPLLGNPNQVKEIIARAGDQSFGVAAKPLIRQTSSRSSVPRSMR
jgi:hypothetical protein